MSLSVVVKASQRRIYQWTQAMLLALSLVMLGYCGFVQVDTFAFQWSEHRNFERLLLNRAHANPAPPALGANIPAQPPVQPAGTVVDGVLGRLDIPRLGLSVIVVEGTSKADLRRAVGHIRGTALPGQVGNAGISGHRDTFFRPLRNIHHNDIVSLTTVLGEHRYRVVATAVVDPSDVSVLASGQDEILTLVTCYPFYYAGPAPSRFIVRAVRFGKPYEAGSQFSQ